MIMMQIISILVVVFVIVLLYATFIKLVNEHRELHNKNTDQDDLDLTDKQ